MAARRVGTGESGRTGVESLVVTLGAGLLGVWGQVSAAAGPGGGHARDDEGPGAMLWAFVTFF